MKYQTVVYKSRKSNAGQQGYVLLVLLLTMCFIAIAAAAVAPTIAFEIKRDREEEFIHRAVEYSRAVRRFAKSTGRYPLDLGDLSGKNGTRYIRKIYKDPITGRDFKLLYTRDIMSATANVPQNGTPVQTDSGNSAPDANQDQSSTSPPADQQNNPGTGNTAINPAAQSRFYQPTQNQPGGAGAGITGNAGASNGSMPGAFFGVVSTSKEKTIREFEHKNHYNDWLFFYDLNHDTGHLVTGPTRLSMPAVAQYGQPAGQVGQPVGGAPAGGAPTSTPQQTGNSPEQPASPPTN